MAAKLIVCAVANTHKAALRNQAFKVVLPVGWLYRVFFKNPGTRSAAVRTCGSPSESGEIQVLTSARGLRGEIWPARTCAYAPVLAGWTWRKPPDDHCIRKKSARKYGQPTALVGWSFARWYRQALVQLFTARLSKAGHEEKSK